jgi:hypothetical protein
MYVLYCAPMHFVVLVALYPLLNYIKVLGLCLVFGIHVHAGLVMMPDLTGKFASAAFQDFLIVSDECYTQ